METGKLGQRQLAPQTWIVTHIDCIIPFNDYRLPRFAGAFHSGEARSIVLQAADPSDKFGGEIGPAAAGVIGGGHLGISGAAAILLVVDLFDLPLAHDYESSRIA